MVVLQVTSDCSAPEWVMFELQGDVERRVGQISGEDFKIGTVTFCNTKRRQAVELVIGYHKLEGKLVPLQKPLAMLQKHCDSGGEGACAQASEYKVVGVIRKKCIFKSRPISLISKPAGR